MKVADYVALELQRRGVTHVYELVGGMITFLLDSLNQRTAIKIVSMHHEQGAGFAAEGHARISGIPGVALATSGPGATNLITAIGSCYFDSVPAVFITGQVNRHEQRGKRAIRQLGFQETDIVSITSPITKAAWLANDPATVPSLLERAFAIATSGRPGPVLIDIPMDVQRAEIEGTAQSMVRAVAEAKQLASVGEVEAFWTKLNDAFGQAKRPLILAGGGLRSGRAVPVFRQLADRLGVPVVHSLMAVDCLPASNALRVGLIGSYGNRWANTALSEADVLLILGSRLDVRQTGSDTEDFRSGKAIYHVDCEAGEINNRVRDCEALVCELSAFITADRAVPWRGAWADSWFGRLADLKRQWPDVAELAGVRGVNPNAFMHLLSRASGRAAAFVTDVGQHQMWAAQSLELLPSQRFLTSGGMGAMGFALPTAIGACFAAGGAPVVVIAGDGGFQLNIQELQTVVRNGLPLKMVVLNNQSHGMVRQFQESYFKGRLQSTVWGYSAPSFTAVAQAYGIATESVAAPKTVESGLAKMWEDPKAPFLLEITIATAANVFPKMAFGRPMHQMEPFARPLDMEGT